MSNTNANVMIGRRDNNTLPFNGQISRTILFNLALTPAEVRAYSSGAPVPFKYIGASQTEFFTTAEDRTLTAGTSDWTNAAAGDAMASFDKTTDLSLTADAVGDYAYITLTNIGAALAIGKRYRLTYDYSETVAGFEFKLEGAATQTLGDAVAGTSQTIEFAADEDFATTDELRIMAKTSAVAEGDFDNFSIVQIGAVLQLEQDGITDTTWVDSSGNDLDGTISGAIVTNPMPNLYVAEQDGTVKIMTDSAGNVGIGTPTPAGKLHTILSAGSPAIFAGATNATLTGVAISNADPSVLTKDATIDDGLVVGDLVVVNSGANCTVGEYVVTGITADTNVTLDRQAATGACSAGNITYVNGEGLTVSSTGQMILSDGVGATIIRQFNETGLGSRFTIGLPEVSRMLVIADAGDVDRDFGLSPQAHPTIVLFDSSGVQNPTRMYVDDGSHFIVDADRYVGKAQYFIFEGDGDNDTNDFITMDSVVTAELTDTDGEQAWLYIEPKINQSGTAAYNGLHVNVLEATPGPSFGDGSTGQGNNLLLLERESVPYFRVDRDGTVVASGGVVRVIGNNAALELEDDSGNLSRIKSGNSQLTISADPDNAVASTDIIFEIDGVEVGRFQEGLGLQSVKGFATQLWDIAGGNWETAVINTEYYSPNQCGGIYGIIYRQYFNTVLTSTNPRLDTGSIVTKMVDYVLHSKYTTSDRGLGHGNMTAYGSSDNHAYLMLSGASGGGNLSFGLTGYTVITGWVDYTK
ncbi:hypothetical protein LCGC14_1823860, partial [marine sediment metagenome]